MATDQDLFQILEIPEPFTRAKHLLGIVLRSNDQTTPLNHYAPYFFSKRWDSDEGKQLKAELVREMQFLWDGAEDRNMAAVPLNNLLSDRDGSKSSDAVVRLTAALKSYFNKNRKKNFRIEGGETEQYNIDNLGAVLSNRLSPCKPWLDEVQELYDKDTRPIDKRKYVILSGLWVCKGAKVSYGDEEGTDKGIDVKAPLSDVGARAGNAMGAPVPAEALKSIDLEGKLDRSKEQRNHGSAELTEPTIFAVRYHVLELEFQQATTESSAKGQKSPQGFFSSFIKKVRRTNSGPTEAPKPKIKSGSLGRPVRGGKNTVGSGSYASAPDELLYWKEPEYVTPDEIGADESDGDATNQPNGVAH